MCCLRSKVVFADSRVKGAYQKLNSSRSEDRLILSWLDNAFDDIADDAFCGIQIPKKQIPEKYRKEYEIDNLWKYNLPNGWRLLYSVARDEVIVISIIIEWLDHKNYERRFGY